DLWHLFSVGGLVAGLDGADRPSRRVQDRPPVCQVALGEDRIQDLYQRAGVLLARRAGRKARIVGEVWPADRGHEPAPLPRFIEEGHDEPAPVAALIMVRQGIGGLHARRPMRHVLPAQPTLDETGIGPQAVL